ncbi:HECT-domain protein, partial [Cooperia oncophora]
SARLRPKSKRTDDPSIRVSGVSASSSGTRHQVHLLTSTNTHPLPAGWEACTDRKGRTFYIDHTTKRTTWQRPSLESKEVEHLKRPPLPPITPHRSSNTFVHRIRKMDFVAFVNLFADDTQPLPMNWQASGRNPLDKNGNLLDLASRTAEIALLVEERLPELAPKIRKKLRLIERLGAVALARLANDVDLITAISILDSDDPAVSSEFEEKLNHFYASLHRSGYGKGPQKVKFRFSRSNLLQDAFDQILAADPVTLRVRPNPSGGSGHASTSEAFDSVRRRRGFPSGFKMELAGRVLGLALLHRCLIDTFFTRTFYKMLLEQPVTVLDLQDVDQEFFRSMMWIRENPIDKSLGMTFVVTEEENGQVIEKELLPNGADLDVSDHNKEEFISLMVKWRVERGIQRQSRALLRGLHQIIDRDFLRVFTVDQVELVLSGSREIDLEDWRKNTEYRFVTGTSSIPFEGFAMLRGSNGPKRFTIEKWGEESALPRAHTCFNRLDLPSYPTRHILKAKLHTAITEGISYAIE